VTQRNWKQNKHPWILVVVEWRDSTCECTVYDSLPREDPTSLDYMAELQAKLRPLLPACLLQPRPLVVRLAQPALQEDGSSCGVFAAAWCCLLAHRQDPFRCRLAPPEKLRQWILDSLQSNCCQLPPYEPVSGDSIRTPPAYAFGMSAPPSPSAEDTASIAFGSLLSDLVFIRHMLELVHQHPSLRMAHVAPSILQEWIADDAQTRTQKQRQELQASIEHVLREAIGEHTSSPVDVLVLHCTQPHDCSILINLRVWKQGPTRHSRRNKRDQPVPLLHIDTLIDSCSLDAGESTSSILQQLCTVLNRITETNWSYGPNMLHHIGVPQQRDDWSCGYRLLYIWHILMPALSSALQDMTTNPFAAQYFDELCNKPEHLSMFGAPQQLVTFVRDIHAQDRACPDEQLTHRFWRHAACVPTDQQGASGESM